MHRLMKNRGAAAVGIYGWREDAIGSIRPAGSIGQRRKNRIVIGLEGQEWRRRGICRVFRRNFLAEYMVVKGRSRDNLPSIRSKRRQLVCSQFRLFNFIGTSKYE